MSIEKNYKIIHFNPLPNGKILNVTKFKPFADHKLTVANMMISLFDRVENTVGKGHFLLFPVSDEAFFFRVIRSGLCGKEFYPFK